MIATLLTAALLAPPPTFDRPALDSWDGKGWGGIRVDLDADADIKKKFQAGKGAVRPEAVRLNTVSGGPVDVLLAGRGGKAKAIGFYWEPKPAVLLSDLEFAEEGVLYFHPERYEDWGVMVWPNGGIMAKVSSGAGDEVYVDGVILAKPDFIPGAIRNWRKEPTDIREVPDPGKGWDRMLRVYELESRTEYRGDGLVPESVASNARRAEDEAYRAMSRLEKPFVYDRRSRATMEVRVSVDKIESGGKARYSVRVLMEIPTPYETIEVDLSESGTFNSDQRSRLESLARRVADNAQDDAVRKLNTLRPPAPETFTRTQFLDFLKLAAPF